MWPAQGTDLLGAPTASIIYNGTYNIEVRCPLIPHRHALSHHISRLKSKPVGSGCQLFSGLLSQCTPG
jgi:hypothetical protein